MHPADGDGKRASQQAEAKPAKPDPARERKTGFEPASLTLAKNNDSLHHQLVREVVQQGQRFALTIVDR
jgi:hypothetical protein